MIEVTLHDAEVQRLIERLTRRLGNLTPVMHEIGQRYERRVLENFEGSHAPDGTPWARLSAVTLMLALGRKKRLGKRGLTKRGKAYLGNKKPLIESGRLRSRIHYQAGAESVKVGLSGIEYAAIHQFGGKAGRNRKVTIPARPYLAMNTAGGLALADRDRRMVVEVLRRHLDEL